MSKSGKKKLIKWLKKWGQECSYNHDCHDCKKGNKCAEAYLKIKELIERQPEVSLGWIRKQANILFKEMWTWSKPVNTKASIKRLLQELGIKIERGMS